MRFRTPQFIVVFAILVIFGLAVGFLDTAGRETEAFVRFQRMPNPQRLTERQWVAVGFRSDLVIAGVDGTGFKLPFGVRVGDQGHIYVLDFADGSVNRFAPDGRFERRFGSEGSGNPGGFMRPSDFALDDDGIWVADSAAGTLTRFDESGSITAEIEASSRPLRLLVLGDRLIIEIFAPADHLFESYTRDGELLRRFGVLVEEQSQNFAALEGWIAEAGDSSFIYVPFYAGFFARFSSDGDLSYVAETVQPVGPVVLDVDRNSVRRVRSKGQNSAFNAGITGKLLYLVTTQDGGAGPRTVMDFYGVTDGEYRYSVKLPRPCRFAFMIKETLFTVEDRDVTRWRIDDWTVPGGGGFTPEEGAGA